MANSEQRQPFTGLLMHFRPATVPERTLRISLTWGLGGIAAVLVLLLFATGLLLKFVYQPVPAQAYESVLYLENQVPFGQLLRNLHRWSGYGLMAAAFLHLLRVFYTGAYAPPRRINWIIGLVLFAAVVASNFTGYLLPWDQIAYWAVTVSTSMLDYLPVVGGALKGLVLGGPEPGPATLMNFYALHTAVLPAILVFVLPFHFWHIRKANGLVIPRSPSEQQGVGRSQVAAMPHLFVREATMALLVLAAVVLLAMWFDAPLAAQANPGLSPNPTKAPWYFMGLQELLMHLHPILALLVIPLLTVAAVLAIPWIDPSPQHAGVWFRSRRGRRTALLAVAVGAITTAAAILVDEFIVRPNPSDLPRLVQDGLLTSVLIVVVFGAFLLLIRKSFAADRSEILQALFTLLLSAFAVLTITGIWFRGEGMQLIWPGS